MKVSREQLRASMETRSDDQLFEILMDEESYTCDAVETARAVLVARGLSIDDIEQGKERVVQARRQRADKTKLANTEDPRQRALTNLLGAVIAHRRARKVLEKLQKDIVRRGWALSGEPTIHHYRAAARRRLLRTFVYCVGAAALIVGLFGVFALPRVIETWEAESEARSKVKITNKGSFTYVQGDKEDVEAYEEAEVSSRGWLIVTLACIFAVLVILGPIPKVFFEQRSALKMLSKKKDAPLS